MGFHAPLLSDLPTPAALPPPLAMGLITAAPLNFGAARGWSCSRGASGCAAAPRTDAGVSLDDGLGGPLLAAAAAAGKVATWTVRGGDQLRSLSTEHAIFRFLWAGRSGEVITRFLILRKDRL